jgi:hypothetical protein
MKLNENGVEVNRSELYYVMNPVSPIDHSVKARFDVLGSVLTIGIMLGGMSMIRLFVSWL